VEESLALRSISSSNRPAIWPADKLLCLANAVKLQPGGDSPTLLHVAVWQLLNHLGSKILLRFPFVLGRRKAGFDCPDIWHLPIPVLLCGNCQKVCWHKRLDDTGVKTLPK
jgi:hypothetical protein